jgi:hypothetical protein
MIFKRQACHPTAAGLCPRSDARIQPHEALKVDSERQRKTTKEKSDREEDAMRNEKQEEADFGSAVHPPPGIHHPL